MLCPRCGGEKEHFAGKICVDCFLEREGLVEVEEGLELTICVSCGAIRIDGWRDTEMEDAVSLLVREAASLPDELETPVVEVEVERVLPDEIEATVTVEGDLGGRWVVESVPADIKVSRGVCRRCSRSERGYFEALLQVRAERRGVREEELDEIVEAASSLASSAAEAGGQKPFVSRVERTEGGFDLYMGDSAVARKLSRRLKERFGGSTSESASLMGRRDGREVHRITHLVRLPPFGEGDVLRFRGRIFAVRRLAEAVELVDIEKGVTKRAPSKQVAEEAEVVGEVSDAEEAVLTMVEGDEVQVLEPETMRAVTLPRPSFVEPRDQGGSVKVLRLDGELVPVNPEATG